MTTGSEVTTMLTSGPRRQQWTVSAGAGLRLPRNEVTSDVDGNGNDGRNRHSSRQDLLCNDEGDDEDEDENEHLLGVHNKTFFETDTLCSWSTASFDKHPFRRPLPIDDAFTTSIATDDDYDDCEYEDDTASYAQSSPAYAYSIGSTNVHAQLHAQLQSHRAYSQIGYVGCPLSQPRPQRPPHLRTRSASDSHDAYQLYQHAPQLPLFDFAASSIASDDQSPLYGYGDRSFLLSCTTSCRTMASLQTGVTVAATAAESESDAAAADGTAVGRTSDNQTTKPLLLLPTRTATASPSLGSEEPSGWARQELEIGFRLPSAPAGGGEDGSNLNQRQPQPQPQQQQQQHKLDRDLLLPEVVQVKHRPSSSRSHIRWRSSSKTPETDEAPYERVSDTSLQKCDTPMMSVTREEFLALPPTIQRKYFSTIERSLLVHSPTTGRTSATPNTEGRSRASSAVHLKPPPARRHPHRAVSDVSKAKADQAKISPAEQRFYAGLPDKIKRRHLTEEEQLVAHYHRQSTIFSATDDAVVRAAKIRSFNPNPMQSPTASPVLSDDHSTLSSMSPREQPSRLGKSDSFYDSFRWLEEEDGLDLRLYLDDYHINLREEIPVPHKDHRPSFRRHLSINKLPFGRSSVSYIRPSTKDASVSSRVSSPMNSPAASPSPGGRRRSRALSLISPQKQPMGDSLAAIDKSAAHYQDPQARLKLRAFLASPQKFDEAVEFGFPSMEAGLNKPLPKLPSDTERLNSFLEDDQSSRSSDDSLADPETPTTPQQFEKPAAPVQAPRPDSGRKSVVQQTAPQKPTPSREMTLRMTLTRPDLRANEDQIYSWKRNGNARGVYVRDETTPTPIIYAKDADRKQSIERQLAAMDHWQSPNDSGMVKRIWNRVRRS